MCMYDWIGMREGEIGGERDRDKDTERDRERLKASLLREREE